MPAEKSRVCSTRLPPNHSPGCTCSEAVRKRDVKGVCPAPHRHRLMGNTQVNSCCAGQEREQGSVSIQCFRIIQVRDSQVGSGFL